MKIELCIRRRLVSRDREFALDVTLDTDTRRVALFGPSGAGKTLTIQAVAGLMRPDQGRIAINGRVLFDSEKQIDVAPAARKVAYLFQDYGLFPHLTVLQNICFGLKKGWRNPGRRDIPEAARRWIDTFELEAIIHSLPAEISGGQKQRVALARALAVEPDILLLDEPLAALHAALRKKLRMELAALQQRLEIPMIVITHDPADVLELADEVYEIGDGVITGSASPRELFARGD
ncbi:sulfate/molybdate ABC transporter ATP-binding protein [Paralcaligenes ureilyticus]|uniref:Molybdate transport system ATP-binding protein n=1 Tax=Paralcaligenes ureilyticus TaxID=627131 RepID=A0A4R3M832_9BURK|nr:ATP-binding cassette domain-containing protein [Paralcaligenes ureilyticus]TCT09520.1 molybdate transport system ATP-binding protein [Paralcaligenes ureilyticus]